MATITLYFEPYPEAGADGMVIEESADGEEPWVEIESLTTEVGSYPDYISSFTTTNATNVSYWFRIAWKVGGITQQYSDGIQVGALAPKYTTPDQVQAQTRIPALQALETAYVDLLIDQAYYMLQNHCGPFDEDDEDFIEIAPLAMRLYVEYLFVTTDPSALSAITGIVEEKIGSYSYKRTDKAYEIWLASGSQPPPNVTGLICRFSLSDEDVTELITTSVFGETIWYDGEEVYADRRKVYVEGDADIPAPSVVAVYSKYPSV